jgi:hypothetical protein
VFACSWVWAAANFSTARAEWWNSKAVLVIAFVLGATLSSLGWAKSESRFGKMLATIALTLNALSLILWL